MKINKNTFRKIMLLLLSPIWIPIWILANGLIFLIELAKSCLALLD